MESWRYVWPGLTVKICEVFNEKWLLPFAACWAAYKKIIKTFKNERQCSLNLEYKGLHVTCICTTTQVTTIYP